MRFARGSVFQLLSCKARIANTTAATPHKLRLRLGKPHIRSKGIGEVEVARITRGCHCRKSRD